MRWAVDCAGHFCAIRRESRAWAPILGSYASNAVLKCHCPENADPGFLQRFKLGRDRHVKRPTQCMQVIVPPPQSVTITQCDMSFLNYLSVQPPLHYASNLDKFCVFCCCCHKSTFIGLNTDMVCLSKTRRLHSQGSLRWKGSACPVQAVRFLQRDEGC